MAEIRRLRDTAAEARLLLTDEPEPIRSPGIGHPIIVAAGAILFFAVIGFAFTVRSVLEMIFG